MAKVTQKTDDHSTCQESSFKTPNIYTTAFFFGTYLDLHSNMLSLGSKISEAYWCCVFVTDSRKKKKECLLEILNYNMPSPGLWSSGCGAWRRPEPEGPPPCPGAFPSPILVSGVGLSDVSV